jgi:hypothetical protein
MEKSALFSCVFTSSLTDETKTISVFKQDMVDAISKQISKYAA